MKLLIFLPAILILAWASSSLAFCMIYFACKLNKQGDNIQPWRTPFPVQRVCCSMTVSNCCIFTGIQVSQEAGKVVWYSISWSIFHSLLWSRQSKALAQSMKQMFFCNYFAFCMIQWMLAIWSLVSLPFLIPACTSGSSQLTYCWSLVWLCIYVYIFKFSFFLILFHYSFWQDTEYSFLCYAANLCCFCHS